MRDPLDTNDAEIICSVPEFLMLGIVISAIVLATFGLLLVVTETLIRAI